MPEEIPPQRKVLAPKERKRQRRQPRLRKDEVAAIDANAREVAKQVNEELEKFKEEHPSRKYDSLAERRKATNRAAKRRQRAREKVGKTLETCKGWTWKGTRCQLPPLIPDNWDGPDPPTGLYCIHHDPNITQDQADAYLLHGSANQPLPRRVTPGELAHRLVQRSPEALLNPYLKALGLKIDDDGELVPSGRKGLVLHGYSRGGEVVRSPYQDIVGQVNIAEKLMDRIYGKPRQAVDLASGVSTVSVRIEMTIERVDKVTGVLMQAGVLTNGNGNGHQDVIEGSAESLD